MKRVGEWVCLTPVRVVAAARGQRAADHGDVRRAPPSPRGYAVREQREVARSRRRPCRRGRTAACQKQVRVRLVAEADVAELRDRADDRRRRTRRSRARSRGVERRVAANE